MVGQLKISNFFSGLGSKRCLSGSQQNSSNKKQKVEENKNENQHGEQSSLNHEQKEQIEANRLAALAKIYNTKSRGLLVNVGPSWLKALEPEFSKPYFVRLCEFLKDERTACTVYPPTDKVFTWTNMCSIRDVKVVILGQDPYHGPNQAHGLCFSVGKDVPPPPSLENMFKELQEDIHGFTHPGHGTLIGWAEQGVLLLNACMTVRHKQANSHKDKGWEELTDAVIRWLNENMSGLIFLLWGSYAQKKGSFINKKRHHILKAVHPSPLSAYKGFFGCKHFSKTNQLLKEQNKEPINWMHLPSF